MAVSDAHRRGNAKWDKENMRVVSCKIRSEEHAAFKAYAEARGKTISSLLLEYVRSCIAEDMEQKKNIEQNCIPANIIEMEHTDYDSFLNERRRLMAQKIKSYYYSL